jgi:hypothetical protein
MHPHEKVHKITRVNTIQLTDRLKPVNKAIPQSLCCSGHGRRPRLHLVLLLDLYCCSFPFTLVGDGGLGGRLGLLPLLQQTYRATVVSVGFTRLELLKLLERSEPKSERGTGHSPAATALRTPSLISLLVSKNALSSNFFRFCAILTSSASVSSFVGFEDPAAEGFELEEAEDVEMPS